MARDGEGASSLRAATGVQSPFHLVEAAGTPVAVARRGRGTPVLCLHATGHGGRDFDAFSALASSAGFEVVVLDWPGQGASPADATGAPAGGERYAEILAALIPKLFADRPPIILGNSIGGLAALRFAALCPGAARALVLVDPGGLIALDGLTRCVIGAMAAFFAAGARGAAWFPVLFSLYYRMVLPGRPARTQRRRIVAAGRETAPVLQQAWTSFALPTSDLRRALAGLDLPILFVWSRQDRIVSWSRSRAAVKTARNASVRFFPGGHAAFLEAPDPFFRAFVSFAGGLPD